MMKGYCSRRRFLRRVAGGLLGCSVAQKLTARAGASTSPNLVFVFPDQMRAQAMGFMNEDPVITPNLDRFARESLVLPSAVSNYPVCSPYRAMLMTGRWPHSNGVLSNCNSGSAPYGVELRESDRCWSDVLKDRGYSLGYIGKWHLDAPYRPYVKCENNSDKFAWNEWCSPNRRHGFDFWYAYGTYDYHLTPMYWATDSRREAPIRVKQWGPEHEADLASKYLSNAGGKYRDASKPFALVVSMNPPHTPYQLVPQKYLDAYAGKTPEDLINRANVNLEGDTPGGKLARRHMKNYFAMVTGVDDQFGRILKAIEDRGLKDNTIVVFTSDHGNCMGSHEQPTKNVHYEESMRIPFLIRWPGRIKVRHDDLLLSTPDICPTLLDLMGFAGDIPKETDGISHASLFLTGRGKRPKSQLYMWVPVGKPGWGRRGVRTHRYTLMIDKMPDKPIKHVLHDNVNDPYQLKNIADAKPVVVEKLTAELRALLRKNNDPWLKS
ncbi:MAG: sulfatase family protein [Planctomycetota bacterium]|jgi:arylsulfatase A-like enzyme